MPRTAEDVETFLLQLNRNFEGEGGTFIVSSGVDRPPIAVQVSDPIVVVRVDIGALPKDDAKQLQTMKQLLRYNGADLVHVAYALEEDEIVLSAGLALQAIDENELAAVLSDIDLALSRHVPTLLELTAEA